MNGHRLHMKSSAAKINNLFQRFIKDQQPSVKPTLTEPLKPSLLSPILPPPSPLDLSRRRKSISELDGELTDPFISEHDDDDIAVIQEHVHEYYFAVRVLPGQSPRSAFVGWVTSRFKPMVQPDTNFDGFIRRCTIAQTDRDGSVVSSIQKQDAYMFNASELLANFSDSAAVARRVVNGLLIGCLCDVSTGLLTFYVNGKESTEKFQVEPNTRLYPAVFIEPTTKEVMQFELGRIKVRTIIRPLLHIDLSLLPLALPPSHCRSLPQFTPRRTLPASSTLSTARAIARSLPLVTRAEQQPSLSTTKTVRCSWLEYVRRRCW